MTILNEKNSLLMIIDIQDKLINASYNKLQIEKNAVIMAKAAGILGIPTIVTEQYPKGLGATISEIKDGLGEKAAYIEKTSFSALEKSPNNVYARNMLGLLQAKRGNIEAAETQFKKITEVFKNVSLPLKNE